MAEAEAPTDMETKINVAIGEASSCWSNLSGAGVFDSTRAVAIAERLLSDVRAYLVLDASLDDRPDWRVVGRQRPGERTEWIEG